MQRGIIWRTLSYNLVTQTRTRPLRCPRTLTLEALIDNRQGGRLSVLGFVSPRLSLCRLPATTSRSINGSGAAVVIPVGSRSFRGALAGYYLFRLSRGSGLWMWEPYVAAQYRHRQWQLHWCTLKPFLILVLPTTVKIPPRGDTIRWVYILNRLVKPVTLGCHIGPSKIWISPCPREVLWWFITANTKMFIFSK